MYLCRAVLKSSQYRYLHTTGTLGLDCHTDVTDFHLSHQWTTTGLSIILTFHDLVDFSLVHAHSDSFPSYHECPSMHILCSCHQMFVPCHRHSVYGRWTFCVAGLMAWNLLPDAVCDPTCSFDSFQGYLKASVSLRACTVR